MPADHQLDFVAVRDAAVTLGQLAQAALTVEDLDRAISDGERAMSLGPILDPTLWRDGGPSLRESLRYLRAVRDFRAAIETFRPAPIQEVPRAAA